MITHVLYVQNIVEFEKKTRICLDSPRDAFLEAAVSPAKHTFREGVFVEQEGLLLTMASTPRETPRRAWGFGTGKREVPKNRNLRHPKT